MSSLAILDLSDFEGSARRRSAFLSALRTALHRDGFFYLTGHGITGEQTSRIMEMSRRFFALPMEEKLAIDMVRLPHFRGYTRAGHERTRGEPDWREQLDINSEAAPHPMDAGTPAWRRLQGPNQWPNGLPELRPQLLAYQADVTRLGIDLLRAVATALGQSPDAFAVMWCTT